MISLNFIKNIFMKIPLIKIFFFNNELIFKIKSEFLFLILFFFKNHQISQFKILSYITAVDYLNLYNRFELNYELLSIIYTQKCRIKFIINELDKIDSIESLYDNANWLEREIWDLFGIYFKNNLDLRRILTDYGFSFFPLRKNFPLVGFFDIFYNPLSKIVTYKNSYVYQIKNKKNYNFNWFFIF